MPRDARQVLTELLVLAAQGGDERAFADLHDLWARDLRRFAMARLGNGGGSEEVVQDAWLAIARNLGQLADPACFPRWALRIVERRSADRLRRRRQDSGSSVPLTDAILARTPAPSADDDPDADGLRTAIAALAPDARTLLHLFYEQGLSVAEVADVLDVPVGTVKSRLFTLRNTLRQLIERRSHP